MSLKFITVVDSEKKWQETIISAAPTTLCVLDVHAGWCGPCTGLGKRITNLSGDMIECVA